MELFESLVALSLIALLLLGAARRLDLPYPMLVALAGLAFAALPFAPQIEIEPHLALALFIAPALLHAAHDTSLRGLRRYWVPLTALAVVAVLLTALGVAALGVVAAGLPFVVALTLGAVVAPPDAAAASAVLGEMGLPRRGLFVLQGESLLNDATALLLFGLATALAANDTSSATLIQLGIAVPGGILLGIVAARVQLRVMRLFEGTLGAGIVDFALVFALWLAAERLHLSPVLTVVAFGIVLARCRPELQPARDRLQAAAVWAAVIFVLNVLAFLLMGLQARAVLSRLDERALWPAIGFGLLVLAAVLVIRIVWVLAFRAFEGFVARNGPVSWMPAPPPWRGAVLVSWAGMRGLLTLATAFALPAGFPSRDLIVLAAFIVVLGTLVIQGATLAPLIRTLGLANDGETAEKVAKTRRTILDAGLDAIADVQGPDADALRVRYQAAHDVVAEEDDPQGVSSVDALQLRMIAAERDKLLAMRRDGEVADDVYRRLEHELDWAEVDMRSFSENVLRAS